MSNLIKGLIILEKYSNTKYSVGAEHDVICYFRTCKEVIKRDVERLISLDWSQEDAQLCADTDEFTVDCYDPEEGWMFYV